MLLICSLTCAIMLFSVSGTIWNNSWSLMSPKDSKLVNTLVRFTFDNVFWKNPVQKRRNGGQLWFHSRTCQEAYEYVAEATEEEGAKNQTAAETTPERWPKILRIAVCKWKIESTYEFCKEFNCTVEINVIIVLFYSHFT